MTRELIGDHDPRRPALPLQQLPQQALRCPLVALALHQHIEHHAGLVHGTPEPSGHLGPYTARGVGSRTPAISPASQASPRFVLFIDNTRSRAFQSLQRSLPHLRKLLSAVSADLHRGSAAMRPSWSSTQSGHLQPVLNTEVGFGVGSEVPTNILAHRRCSNPGAGVGVGLLQQAPDRDFHVANQPRCFPGCGHRATKLIPERAA